MLTRLHFNSKYGIPIANASGVRDICLIISSLPLRFKNLTEEGVTVVIVFIDTFHKSHRFLPSPPLKLHALFVHTRANRTPATQVSRLLQLQAYYVYEDYYEHVICLFLRFGFPRFILEPPSLTLAQNVQLPIIPLKYSRFFHLLFPISRLVLDTNRRCSPSHDMELMGVYCDRADSPNGNRLSKAMIYCVGPQIEQATDETLNPKP